MYKEATGFRPGRGVWYMASFDVASNVCQAIACHVIDTHFENSLLELDGIL